VAVGTTLAKKIVVPDKNKDLFDNLIKENLNFMFLCAVKETDIIKIVKNC